MGDGEGGEFCGVLGELALPPILNELLLENVPLAADLLVLPLQLLGPLLVPSQHVSLHLEILILCEQLLRESLGVLLRPFCLWPLATQPGYLLLQLPHPIEIALLPQQIGFVRPFALLS